MKAQNVFDALGKGLDNENYFTNCFAFILNSNVQLLHDFLSNITMMKQKDLATLDGLKVEPQISYWTDREQIADIEISSEDKKLFMIIENKIESSVSVSQIKHYINETLNLKKKEGYLETYLVLITKKNETETIKYFLNKPEFIYQKWEYIYRTICSYIDFRKANNYLVTFLEFMQSKGMAPPEGFKEDYGDSWVKFADFLRNADYVLEVIAPKLQGLSPGFVKMHDSNKFDTKQPYVGYLFHLRELQRRKGSLRYPFEVWVGFWVLDSEVKFGVSVDFYPLTRFLRFLQRKHKKRLSIWFSKLKKLHWETYEDDGEAERLEPLKNLLDNAKGIETQIEKLFLFAKQRMTEVRSIGTYELVRSALRRYKP